MLKKMKKMKERIMSLALALVMVVSLFAGAAPVEVQAAATQEPTEAELSAKLNTVEVTLTVENGYYQCSDLPTPTSENYKWVYWYLPVRTDHEGYTGLYEGYRDNFNSALDNMTMDDMHITHSVTHDMLLMDMQTDLKIPVSAQGYGLLCILQIYDYNIGSSEDEGEYYYNRIAMFNLADASVGTTVSNGLEANDTSDESIYNIIDKIDVAINNYFLVNLSDGTFREYLETPFVLGESATDVYEFYRSSDYALYDSSMARLYDGDPVDIKNNTYYIEQMIKISDQESLNRFANQMSALSGDENFSFSIVAASDSDAGVDYNFYATIRYEIKPTRVGDTYDITLDRTNYEGDDLLLYTYDRVHAVVEGDITENNTTVSIPTDGSARVFGSGEFTVAAEGATVTKIYIGAEGGDEGAFYYEITNFTKDTTVVINPTEEEIPEETPSIHTHDWTGEWTIIKEATETEEGKKETYCVSGCGQKKVAIIPKVGEVDENENLEKDAEVAPEAPIEEATLNNAKTELLASNIFSDTEKALIENGEEARVWLEIDELDDTKITAAQKADMENAAKDALGEDATVTYFDATLFKKVGTADAEPVPTPNVKIQVTIVIPEELLNDDDDVEREYKIVRLHAGVPEIIEGTFDAATGEFTFETDKFSPYGITYADTLVDDDDKDDDDDDDDEDDEDDEDVDDDKNTTTGPTPGTDKKDEVPKTGEMNGTSYALTLMLLSGLGVCFSRKKEGNE